MRTYTRAFAPGGTFFFTVNLADRSITLLTDHIEALRESVRRVREAHPFYIVAMVVLPEHLHAICKSRGQALQCNILFCDASMQDLPPSVY